MNEEIQEIELEFKKLIEEHGKERQSLIDQLEASRGTDKKELEVKLAALCEKMGLPARYIDATYNDYDDGYDTTSWRVYFPKDMTKCLRVDKYLLWDQGIEFYTHESHHPPGAWSSSYSC